MLQSARTLSLCGQTPLRFLLNKSVNLLGCRDVYRPTASPFTTLRWRFDENPCGPRGGESKEATDLLRQGFGGKWCGPMTNVFRGYAKKAKESAKKGKADKPHVQLSDEEIGQVIDFNRLKTQMQSTLDYLKKDYAEQLSLRSSVGVLDKLTVDTPDGKFPVNQLGQVVQKNPQLMMINLAATPQYISCVKTAIMESGMNVNPQQEGTTLYIPVPKVTREHREGLAKNAKALCEKTKEKLRNIQNNCARELKKAKDVHSEDLVFNVQELVMITTKKYIDEAEAIMTAKQAELLGK